MSQLFIPPAGAMQFEITNGWDGTPTPRHLQPFVIWVIPVSPYGVKDSKPDCPHGTAYKILKDALCEKLRKGLGSSDKVCPCVGRIIE